MLTIISPIILGAAFSATPDVDQSVQEPLTIFTSRREESVDEALNSVTILTRQELENSQAQDVLEILRVQAGVDLSRNGGPGTQTSVFLRGTNSNQTLVLIDGVRAASSNSGIYSWENLPVSQIERIEIIRGPRASFYGSDAIGGIIHILTRKSDSFSARVEYGSFDAKRADVQFANGGDTGRFWGSISYQDIGGFSAQNENGFSFDPDDDGFENISLVLGAEYKLSPNHQIGFDLLTTDSEIDFDQGFSEGEGLNIALKAQGDFYQNYRYAITLGRAEDELLTPAFFSRLESDRTDFDAQINYTGLQRQILSLGVAYYDEQGKNTETFSNTTVYDADRENVAIFGSWHYAADNQDFEFSLRYDDNSEFGTEVTGQAAWGINLNDNWRLITSYGTAFHGPTLSQQLSPGFGGLFSGNPDLEPEESNSSELSLRYNDSGKHSWAFNLFSTDIDQLIDFSGVDFQAINISEASINGLEAHYRYQAESWRFNTQFTYQKAEDDTTGNRLLRRPDEKISFSLEKDFSNKALFSLEALYAGDRSDFGTELDDYWLTNLRVRYPLNNNWTLEARLNNLLDEDYELANGFNTAERSAFLAIRWTQ